MFSSSETAAQQRAALTRAIRAAKEIEDGAPGATLSRDLETVTSGYAVGTATVEVKTRPELIELIEAIMFTRRILLDGLQTSAEALSDEWLSVGLWRDPSDNRIMTEITAVIPSSEISEAAAVEIGRQLQQSCIYYLDEEREIPCSPSSSPSSSN